MNALSGDLDNVLLHVLYMKEEAYNMILMSTYGEN